MSDENRLAESPYCPSSPEPIGSVSLDVSYTYYARGEGATTWKARSTDICDGYSWESQMVWQLASLMINEFGRTRDDVANALRNVLALMEAG